VRLEQAVVLEPALQPLGKAENPLSLFPGFEPDDHSDN